MGGQEQISEAEYLLSQADSEEVESLDDLKKVMVRIGQANLAGQTAIVMTTMEVGAALLQALRKS